MLLRQTAAPVKTLVYVLPFLFICIVLVGRDVVDPGFFFKRLFCVLSILVLPKLSLYFLACYLSFFTPLISENKLYKIGVFNLCCDSNKRTVLKSCVTSCAFKRRLNQEHSFIHLFFPSSIPPSTPPIPLAYLHPFIYSPEQDDTRTSEKTKRLSKPVGGGTWLLFRYRGAAGGLKP